MARSFLFFLLMLCTCSLQVRSLELKKVLVLSRHNLRTPLTATLDRMTPKEWPKWNADVGSLTRKGSLLESYMGEYFSAWLKKEGLLPDGCPDSNSVYVYANTRHRTKETARAFAEAAFKNCNVTVKFKDGTQKDPIFSPVVHNTTEAFQQLAKQEIQDKLSESDLQEVYKELNDITDLKNADVCKEDGYCDLTKDKDEVVFEVGEEPLVNGPFFIVNSMVDAFLMSYYEGLPMQDIAWGRIKDEKLWILLTKALKENQNVRFNLTTAATDLIRPLLECIKERIESDTKFTLLVGHDSNLSPLVTSMGFKPYVLPEQFELTPIGGKLVFQKWSDGTKDYLKVEFVYQSWKQLREAQRLSLSNPPKILTMHLKNCVTDANGFCPWSDFEAILNELVH